MNVYLDIRLTVNKFVQSKILLRSSVKGFQMQVYN